MTRKIVKGQIGKHNFVKMRSLKHYNKDDFILKLSNMSWKSVLMCFDVEMAWDSFKTIFHSVLDSVAPVKEVKLKQRTEPWMNSEILQNIRFRDETLNKFRKTNDPDLYKKYCQLRNLVQRETRIPKRGYLTNKIEENVGNSKKLWDQLKKLGYSCKKKESSNVVLEIDGETFLTLKRWQIALMDSLLLLLLTWLTNCLLVLIYFTQSLPLFKIFIKVKMLRMMNLCLSQ